MLNWPSPFSEISDATLFAVAALFPIVNPIASAFMFSGLTRGYPLDIRDSLVRRIAFNSFILLVGSVLIGTYVLRFFGVSLPVVQVAGGFVVISLGWTMLNKEDTKPPSHSVDACDALSSAFYPLTLPLTVGPGSISVAIALGANTHKFPYTTPVLWLSALLGAFIVALSVYICYRSAPRIERLVGEVGLGVFIRLSAFLVLSIGIQLLWNGINALLATRKT